MVNKYVKIYNKRNILLALFCATIAFIPLFAVSLIYDVVEEDIIISFLPFIIAAICVAIASIFNLRFKRMIKTQEQIYNVQFNDTNVINLETTLYLSNEWLIWAGSSAIYKKHIKSIHSTIECGRAGRTNKVTVKTVDNKKYIIWCLRADNVEKIRKWKRHK